MEWLAKKEIPFVIVFTKIDKLSKSTLKRNVEFYKSEMLKKWNALPQIFITSAEKKTGTQEIVNFIEKSTRGLI